MVFVQFGEYSLLVRFVFIATGINFGDEQVEVGVGAEGSLRDKLFSASWAFFVAGPQGGDYAVGTEAMETFLEEITELINILTNKMSLGSSKTSKCLLLIVSFIANTVCLFCQ